VYDINYCNPTTAVPEHRYPCLVIFADGSSFFTFPFWGGMGWGVGVGVALVAGKLSFQEMNGGRPILVDSGEEEGGGEEGWEG